MSAQQRKEIIKNFVEELGYIIYSDRLRRHDYARLESFAICTEDNHPLTIEEIQCRYTHEPFDPCLEYETAFVKKPNGSVLYQPLHGEKKSIFNRRYWTNEIILYFEEGLKEVVYLWFRNGMSYRLNRIIVDLREPDSLEKIESIIRGILT